MPPQWRAKFVICHLRHSASGDCLDLMNVCRDLCPFSAIHQPGAFETNKSSGPAFAVLTEFWQRDPLREKVDAFVD